MITEHSRDEPEYYGARQCPRPEFVIDLLERLKRKLRKRNVYDCLTYHNHYTVYVIVVQTLALAYRGVISPAVADWESITNLVSFTDKAREDYHRRVSYLPPIAQRLNIQYSDHRRYMLRRYEDYRRIDERGLVLALWNEERGRFREFHPGDFDSYSGAYGLPLRSLRRFMRTSLVCQIIGGTIKGFPAELIDGWMGHWHLGLSPREGMSTFSPKLIRMLTQGPVTELLHELGCVAYTSRFINYGR